MNILDRIVSATRERVARDKAKTPLADLKEIPKRALDRFPFQRALEAPGLSFICEVKKASPSKGLIDPDFPYLQIAGDYQAAGADAISVLTEPDFFLGGDKILEEIRGRVETPLLRKDFVIDEYQVWQARVLGADAVLLICRILDKGELRYLHALADALGMSCLVEAHTPGEIETAVKIGARIIGVNNRNLETFAVDVENSRRLRELAPPQVLFVAESGVSTRRDVELLEGSGVDALLVGEAMMRSGDKSAKLRELRGL